MPQRIPQQEQQPSQFSKEVQDEANGYFQQVVKKLFLKRQQFFSSTRKPVQ